MNMDVCKSNNASAAVAIAEFFHCENKPDTMVESPQFKRLVHMCHFVGEDFKLPDWKKIGGELLDLNDREVMTVTKMKMLVWMGLSYCLSPVFLSVIR
jgi:hypothetical protein